MKKFFEKLKNHLPSRRRLIQLYAALLFNANLKGFANGKIYQGPLKNICTPGLNCYSCPGASGACPLGSLQNALGASTKRAPYFVIGIILLYGILLGRTICGFLCPFGLIQDLLYKIKTPKLKKNRVTKLLSYFKYVILAFFVIVLPIMYGLRNVPLPGFCKYICPAGTIEGAFGLLSNAVNESELARLGPLFTWKFILAVSIVVGCIFIYRMFCRFLCPLGALYGIFNRISILGIKLEKPRCIDCGLCVSKCKMDIREVGDHECISCGECIAVCPTQAISYKGGRWILPPNEIPAITEDMTPEEREASLRKTEETNKKRGRRRLVTRITAAVLALSLLVGALLYYNVIDKAEESFTVYEVGDLCPDISIPLFNGTDYTQKTFAPRTDGAGKVTVINFWYTECGGCVAELPDFDRIATDMKDVATVIAVTKSNFMEDSYAYINENYANSDILWGLDTPIDPGNAASADVLFKSFGGGDAYPITVILDKNGRIYSRQTAGLDYGMLFMLINGAANS